MVYVESMNVMPQPTAPFLSHAQGHFSGDKVVAAQPFLSGDYAQMCSEKLNRFVEHVRVFASPDP